MWHIQFLLQHTPKKRPASIEFQFQFNAKSYEFVAVVSFVPNAKYKIVSKNWRGSKALTHDVFYVTVVESYDWKSNELAELCQSLWDRFTTKTRFILKCSIKDRKQNIKQKHTHTHRITFHRVRSQCKQRTKRQREKKQQHRDIVQCVCVLHVCYVAFVCVHSNNLKLARVVRSCDVREFSVWCAVTVRIVRRRCRMRCYLCDNFRCDVLPCSQFSMECISYDWYTKLLNPRNL